MRPDTEPNRHAQRIMTGAVIVTIILAVVSAGDWLISNHEMIATWTIVLVSATVVCYLVGTVTLDIIGEGR